MREMKAFETSIFSFCPEFVIWNFSFFFIKIINLARGSIGFDFGCPNRCFWCYFMMWFFHQKVSKISMDLFCSKYDHLWFFCDYFSKKKPKFQMTNYEQNEKIDVWKSFIFRIHNMFYLRAASKSIHLLKVSPWNVFRHQKALDLYLTYFPKYGMMTFANVLFEYFLCFSHSFLLHSLTSYEWGIELKVILWLSIVKIRATRHWKS